MRGLEGFRIKVLFISADSGVPGAVMLLEE